MPLIDTIDGPARRIYLGVDSVSADVVPMDIYTEMRTLRRTDENLRKYDLFLSGEGKVPKGGGTFTERYVQCLLGTRIVPYDTSHTLKIVSAIITDDGQQGIACFDRSPLSPATLVDIDYQPQQVEVIEIITGGGIGTPAEVADAVWDALQASHLDADSMGEIIQLLRVTAENPISRSGDIITLWVDTVGGTIWRQYDLTNGGRVQV